jgi:predicted ATP-dependent serine protease
MTIVTTKSFYNTVVAAIDPDAKEDTQCVNFIEGSESSFSRQWIQMPSLTERKEQSAVIDQIVADYKQRTFSVTLLSGAPGAGKSIIGLLVSKRLIDTKVCEEVSFCESWDPTSGNHSFGNLSAYAAQYKSRILVVVMDEVDEIIRKIHDDRSQSHHFHGNIKTKTDWNRFLDRFDRKIYRHVILIMTTNKSLAWFNELDQSYMRTGRVNLHITL